MTKGKPSLRKRFWENVPMAEMTAAEWEALCDGCGKCCLVKLEDADTGEVAYTNVACRLFDDTTCRCSQYDIRKSLVPSCVIMTRETIEASAYWLPPTCGYRRLFEGKPLPDWHPLLTGDPDSVHKAGASVVGLTIPEYDVDDDDLEDYLAVELGQ